MKIDILIQNLFHLFILAIIIEVSISAFFSIAALKDMRESTPIATARDIIVLLFAVFLCYKVKILSIFLGTGIKLPELLDTTMSALILTGLANMLRQFFARLRNKGDADR